MDNAGRQAIECSRPGDDDGWGRVVDEVPDLTRRVRRVQRKKDRTGPKACQVERNVVGRLVDLHDDAVADPNAEITQNRRHACRPLIDVAVRERFAAGNPQKGGVEVGVEVFRQR